ncbi:MAG: cyclic nucleotide-binding domain-containing protein [Desulfobacterales bacterium]
MEKQAALAGKLNFIHLGDLLQLLGSNGSTGRLEVTSRYVPNPATVFIQNGNPVDACTAELTGLPALFALFGWTEAAFAFFPELHQRRREIQCSRMEIILDGLRMMDDGKIPKVGPVSFIPGARPEDGKRDVPLIKGPLVDYMYVVDEENFARGEPIAVEGSHGNWLWVVLEGVVDVIKETSQGPVTLLKIGDGGFLGSLESFFRQGKSRRATVIAASDVQLGVLDAQRLSNEYALMSINFRELVLSLDSRLKKVSIRAAAAFQAPDEMTEGLGDLKPLIPQGSADGRVFCIERGEALVCRETPAGFIKLARLDPGEIIGSLPFLNAGHEPRSAGVFGSPNIELRELDPIRLADEFDRLSTTMRNILDNIATSISVTTMLTCDWNCRVKQEEPISEQP